MASFKVRAILQVNGLETDLYRIPLYTKWALLPYKSWTKLNSQSTIFARIQTGHRHLPAFLAMYTATIFRAWSPSGLLSSIALQLRERYACIWVFLSCISNAEQLLLRIEKYPRRMNFNKGSLESRRLHYKHLYKLLVGFSKTQDEVHH